MAHVSTDRAFIELAQDTELWCRRLRTSPRQLAEAVACVGDNPSEVERYLYTTRRMEKPATLDPLFRFRVGGLPKSGRVLPTDQS